MHSPLPNGGPSVTLGPNSWHASHKPPSSLGYRSRHGKGAVGPDFFLMDDNARPPRAHLIDEIVFVEDILWIDWPARYPDLNSIQPACGAQGRAIATGISMLSENPLRPDNRDAERGVEPINFLTSCIKFRCDTRISPPTPPVQDFTVPGAWRRQNRMQRDNKVLLFTAVMRPILAYGCPVLGYAAKTNINILDTLQNSTIQMIKSWPLLVKNSRNRFSYSSLDPNFLSLRKFCNAKKGGNRLVPHPDYIVDALKLTNLAPRFSDESL
ncbi:hypothetical protein TNCV_655721 [Trichonephila clavipes]|nr:hypothetical protein TNCV_655721 [Trichonephila clavipes]